MFDFSSLLGGAVQSFFENLFNQIINFFATTLVNIMSTSTDVLQLPFVQNGIHYAQGLAFVVLVLKTMNEAFQTYILHQNGDPEADPGGLLIRTGQAVAIVATLPWILPQLFIFGTKVATDVANLSTGKMGLEDWGIFLKSPGTMSMVIILMGLGMAIILLLIGIQTMIRGAELALMAVIGPILALNITSNNQDLWSSWFKQVIIICVSQAVQIFMVKGAFSLMTNEISANGLLLVLGWLWIALKSPAFLKQFAYSSGFTGAVGGGVKQAGSMYMMRRMLAR
ncbi:conjugal transfer protein TrbL family protein [Dehalobacter sp. TeCB1]|uniref:conjugal transfer protein TrbL family protein n=1 Tax=Dehalobacter sp. TeCB1 TaxID=1843715 RepID=UPI00083B2E20|nr:conjugal transfer protein TrbL family protein [Dehalobacter sp. TeCB1]OCZ51343.1 hypothetical protein A7D23_13040 [Dehalobacter sp. TeCB1]